MIAKVLGHHDLIELFVSTGLVSRSELDKVQLLYVYRLNNHLPVELVCSCCIVI